MTDDWLKTLKVGDEVAYGYEANGIPSFYFSEVMKVTSTGQVTLENGRRFNPDGVERGRNASWHRNRLEPVSEAKKLIAEYEANQESKLNRHKLQLSIKARLSDFSLEQLERLAEFLDTL
jgi:hypothetical protein